VSEELRSGGVRCGTAFAVLVAAVSAVAVARAGPARPALYWASAPAPAGRVLLDRGSRTVRVVAAAAGRGAHVSLSLLGATPVRIAAHPGNPAVGTLRFPVPHDFALHTFVVTVVARTSGRRRVAIERTMIVSVRARSIALSGPGPVTRWAYVLHRAEARKAPSLHAATVEAVPATTSDSMPNVVRVLQERLSGRGARWVRVALTALPNGQSGWVPRGVVSIYHAVRTRLVVDTRRLTVTLFRNGRRVFSAPAGVGTPRWPTPHGTFYIRERLVNFHDAFYGPVAFGTSARSPTLTDWPGGGIVGIHGTNAPALVPGRVSHGCVRLQNADIVRLARLLPLGTPVSVR
jgi:hypothetical protein